MKVLDFIELIKNILDEQGKSVEVLFDNNVISQNTFYKYKQRYPSLKTLFNIVNYLKVSIDYLLEFKDENNFSYYTYDEKTFYENLIKMIKSKNLSQRQFCRNLNYSRDNIIRWKKGIIPSVQSLLEISQYFGCSIDELLQ